jgi:enamine deaminase RidA (YjgF/YER057c/UK114 family)
MKARHVSTETPWEKEFGYARAVRAGDHIFVSGTVAADREGRALGADAYAQGRAIFDILDEVLRRVGSELARVVRLRVYYPDPAIGADFARALRESFPGGIPALTGVRVTGLVDPMFLVEVECDAIASEGQEAPPRDLEDWDEGGD